MRTPKYHLYLSNEEYSTLVYSLIQLKNKLIEQGRFTDAVDELLIRFASAKKKKLELKINIISRYNGLSAHF